MKLRPGRHHADAIYLQQGDEPANSDPRVAICWNDDVAAAIINIINEHYERTGEWLRTTT
jgi:hypothetical protein